MAIYRRRRIGALGNFLEDQLRQWITSGSAPQIPANAVQTDGSGFFSAPTYSLFNGREETPGFIVWRDDAGTIHGIAIMTSDYTAPIDYQAAIVADKERLRQNIIQTRSTQIQTAIPTFASAYASGDPAYAQYWQLYGPFPSTYDAQFNWLVNAMVGGVLEAGRQDWVDSQSGWEGFMNNTFPVLAASALVGAMVAPVAAAQGFSYGPTGMVSDVVSAEFPELIDAITGGGETIATDFPDVESGVGIDSGPYEDVAGNLYDPNLPAGEAWENTLGPAWEGAVVDSANQNIAIAEVIGDVPAGTLANAIGEGPAATYLDAAREIVAAGETFGASSAPDEEIARVTVTAQKPVDEIAYTYSPTDIVAIDADPGVPGTITGGGSKQTWDAWPSLQTVTAGVSLLTAGTGLYKTLTASDGTAEIPMVYANGPGLPTDADKNTLSQTLAKFPWWLLIAGALAVSGN